MTGTDVSSEVGTGDAAGAGFDVVGGDANRAARAARCSADAVGIDSICVWADVGLCHRSFHVPNPFKKADVLNN
jgi:cytochrome c556